MGATPLLSIGDYINSFELFALGRTLKAMLAIWDHLLLWGAFFLVGLVFGLFMTYGLMSAGKKRRL